jgi:hypothetical protein
MGWGLPFTFDKFQKRVSSIKKLAYSIAECRLPIAEFKIKKSIERSV